MPRTKINYYLSKNVILYLYGIYEVMPIFY